MELTRIGEDCRATERAFKYADGGEDEPRPDLHQRRLWRPVGL